MGEAFLTSEASMWHLRPRDVPGQVPAGADRHHATPPAVHPRRLLGAVRAGPVVRLEAPRAREAARAAPLRLPLCQLTLEVKGDEAVHEVAPPSPPHSRKAAGTIRSPGQDPPHSIHDKHVGPKAAP